MVTQRRELKTRLERDGWKVVEEQVGDAWWVDERWKVESTRRPLGLHVWLSFLVDPQHDWPRGRGEHVWAVGVTSSRPEGRDEVEPTAVAIRRHWSQSLDELAAAIARIRDRAGASQAG
jgi:hypothetical protein